jgi:hypothetical protein
LGWSYYSGTGELRCNDLITNTIYNQNANITTENVITSNITTGNLNTANITTGNITNLSTNNFISSQNVVGAYWLDGSRTSGYAFYPITCSQYQLKPGGSDDVWIVYPNSKESTFNNIFHS